MLIRVVRMGNGLWILQLAWLAVQGAGEHAF